MLLVYAHKISPRFKYIADFVLGDLCGFELAYTNSTGEFVSYDGPKISYFETALAEELHVIPNGLLFEKGIKPQNIALAKWNDIPVLFKNANAVIPFDIFSASFFLLSRYEEYCHRPQNDCSCRQYCFSK